MAGRTDPTSDTRVSLHSSLERWRDAGVITAEQADAIRELEASAPAADRPVKTGITPSTLVTYIGGFLVIVASVVFVALGWREMGDVQRLFWGTLAVVAPWGAGFFLRRLRQPLAMHAGSVLVTAGTVAILLFGFTLYRVLGWWPEPWNHWDANAAANEDRVNQLMMTSQIVAALAAGVFAFRLRVPWMLLITGVMGWIAWTTAIDQWMPREEMEDPALWVMALYGVAFVLAGLVVDRLHMRQYAFWLFLVGLTATFIFLGIDSFDDALGPTGFVFLALAVTAIVLSMVIDYQIFLLYGAIGLYGWVSALIIDAFGGSRSVAAVLIALGVVIVLAGIAWQRWFADRIHHHHDGDPAPAL
jgi:uncharacterized membrane protein